MRILCATLRIGHIYKTLTACFWNEFIHLPSKIHRSLDDPDAVKAVDEQVNAGTSWAVS